MPRKKTQSTVSLESPTSTALIESTPSTSLLDGIVVQLLTTSEQGIEALSTLKAQLAAQHDTPDTPESDSIVQQAWQHMNPDQRALISSRCEAHREKERVRGKSLHQLTAQLEDLDELIDSIEGEEITPELEVAVQQLLEQRDSTYEQWLTKVDNYCAAITNRHALSKQRKAEAERLSKLAATDSKRVEWMKQQLKICLESQGVKKLSLHRFSLTISNNGGVLPLKLICEVEELPPQFQRIEISPDNGAIRQALEAGDIEAQQIAQFGERETHLRVR
ncbi:MULTISPECIES: siphovirus Gp157 family protein [unclassified Microcoleus]|uniref:siphovirus Gp157 family protein n=1 Tax=unclassified Microcoleus TaxID=2642155 RepID=UPI002FD4C895